MPSSPVIVPASSGLIVNPSRHAVNPTTSAPPGSPPAAAVLYSPSLSRRCTPAACTRPAAASRSASWLPQGHQAKATGGSSRPSGVASSGRAGSQPATTRVGRGGPIGWTVIVSLAADPFPAGAATGRPASTRAAAGQPAPAWTARPPAGTKLLLAAASPRSGSATNWSPTAARITRSPSAPDPLDGATGTAGTGCARSPRPNSSSTVIP